MQEHGSEHPWRLTLTQFLDRIQRLYGFTYHEERSGERLLRYLKSPDGALVGLLPIGLRLDDPLDAFTTASLCRHLRLPAEDFGLTREENPEDGA